MFRFNLNPKAPFTWYWLSAFCWIGVAIILTNGEVRITHTRVTAKDDIVAFDSAIVATFAAAVCSLAYGVIVQRRNRGRQKTKVIEEVLSAWRIAAKELGFEFIAPFEIEDGSERVQFHGYVRDFGGRKGAVFFVCENFHEDFGRSLSFAKKQGYFHSRISSDVYRAFDREVFLEVLRDWGWFGPEADRPSWA